VDAEDQLCITGTLSVMYTLLFVIIKSASFGINVDFVNVTNIHFTPLFQATFPALSGMAALSFFIHNIIITIMRNNRKQENNVSINKQQHLSENKVNGAYKNTLI
jgi:sodium-coupled neutral amino acid transporter 9